MNKCISSDLLGTDAFATPRGFKPFLWPATGVLLAALIAINPFYQPRLTREAGILAWLVDTALVLILSVRPATTRFGAVLAGLFLAVPCFVRASALSRFVLICCATLPLGMAAIPLLAPSTASLRDRLAFFFTWFGTHEVTRRPRKVQIAPLLQFAAASTLVAVAMAVVKSVPAAGAWLAVRWLAGGIMIMAFAEVITASHDVLTALLGVSSPPLMRSPYLAKSLGEFWSRRWNPAASSLLFRSIVFRPLARRAVMALWAAFLVSAVAHVLLPQMATGKWGISLACGAFFLLQPGFILAERGMNVRRWRPAATRMWTFAALAITCPLFVEPALQILEPSWGESNQVLLPTLCALGFGLLVNLSFALGSLAICTKPLPNRTALPVTAGSP